ncbi:hypothetical protein K491DRAFT_723773 [Lophiostoma macrostomum CBS 122681]|uniref:Uncharacterized protein n=1 Tax=Lophiostoma macrostomum CBS 122681 TaxID=1314788 RepID=A0A6A6SGX5_9PLEO|nr:hypothetical protein K491DRAFT_723773 [Lophiostoma macrostomum CBS 122681]
MKRAFSAVMGNVTWSREKLIEELGIEDTVQDAAEGSHNSPDTAAGSDVQYAFASNPTLMGWAMTGAIDAGERFKNLVICSPTCSSDLARSRLLTGKLINYLELLRDMNASTGQRNVFIFHVSSLDDDGKPFYIYRCLSRRLLDHIKGNEFVFPKIVEKDIPYEHIFRSLIHMLGKKHGSAPLVQAFIVLHGLGAQTGDSLRLLNETLSMRVEQNLSAPLELERITRTKIENTLFQLALTPPLMASTRNWTVLHLDWLDRVKEPEVTD